MIVERVSPKGDMFIFGWVVLFAVLPQFSGLTVCARLIVCTLNESSMGKFELFSLLVLLMVCR